MTRKKKDIDAANGAPTPAGGAALAVWAALTTNPDGVTAAQLVEAAGVSRSAVTKALTALEGDGHATRTQGERNGGKRTPDIWHPCGTDRAGSSRTVTPETPNAVGGVAEGSPAEGPTPSVPNGSSSQTEESDPGEPGIGTSESVPKTSLNKVKGAVSEDGPTPTDPATASEPGEDGTPVIGPLAPPPSDVAPAVPDGDLNPPSTPHPAVEEARQVLAGLASVITSATQALSAGELSGALAFAETVYAEAAKARRLTRAAATGRKTSAGADRARPGQLRDRIGDHLRAHPGKEFTPYEIGRALGNSAGAVANALDRLVELGIAQLTCERPRRFAAATEHTVQHGVRADETNRTTTGAEHGVRRLQLVAAAT